MSYKLEVTGLDELMKAMEKVGKSAEKAASRGLYKGAGSVADSIRKEANSIKTEKFKYAKDGKQRLPSPEEKAAVVGASGISKFRKNGLYINTSVGYQKSGYANIGGTQKPVALIANSINHGTSFMKKQPFFRKAKSQSKAIAIIEAEVEKEAEELLKSIT